MYLAYDAPFQEDEAYVCIFSHRHGDTILFHHEGGVDIGDVDAKVRHFFFCILSISCIFFWFVSCDGSGHLFNYILQALKLEVDIDEKLSLDKITSALLSKLPSGKKQWVCPEDKFYFCVVRCIRKTKLYKIFIRIVAKFIKSLYDVYVDLYFTYLEINPLGNILIHVYFDVMLFLHCSNLFPYFFQLWQMKTYIFWI